MKYYTDVIEDIHNKLVSIHNYIAISMYVSIVLGVIGTFFWLTDAFFLTNTFISVGALITAITYWVSLVAVLVGFILRAYWGYKWDDAVDDYEEARTRLFKKNLAVANSFYNESRKIS